MKKRIRQFGLISLITVVALACYEPYHPEGVGLDVSYLVVDGFVNSTDGSASVVLSSTTSLTSLDTTLVPVVGASVKLQDASGSTIDLSYQSNGAYSAKGLSNKSFNEYKLVITTSGKTYESDFVPVQRVPSIDTVSWSIDNDNLDINVSAHDDTGSSRYYKWKFVETWEYRPPYQSAFILVNKSILPRKTDEDVNVCWNSLANQKIVIHSTDDLTNDVISNFTIQKIPLNSLKLSTKYSILVKQQSLSKEAYTYWLNIKKTTESLGGIFDPLPGAVTGNIHSITNPDERVLGYFSAGEVSEKRIFISIGEINQFVTYRYPYCEVSTVSDDMARAIDDMHNILSPALDEHNVFVGWKVSSVVCSDCRKFEGGITVKPSFWKD